MPLCDADSSASGAKKSGVAARASRATGTMRCAVIGGAPSAPNARVYTRDGIRSGVNWMRLNFR